MDELYVKSKGQYQRVAAIDSESVTTLVDGRLVKHPAEGVEIVRWDQLPHEAEQLAWMMPQRDVVD